jgi:hypothetical protein
MIPLSGFTPPLNISTTGALLTLPATCSSPGAQVKWWVCPPPWIAVLTGALL